MIRRRHSTRDGCCTSRRGYSSRWSPALGWKRFRRGPKDEVFKADLSQHFSKPIARGADRSADGRDLLLHRDALVDPRKLHALFRSGEGSEPPGGAVSDLAGERTADRARAENPAGPG